MRRTAPRGRMGRRAGGVRLKKRLTTIINMGIKWLRVPGATRARARPPFPYSLHGKQPMRRPLQWRGVRWVAVASPGEHGYQMVASPGVQLALGSAFRFPIVSI